MPVLVGLSDVCMQMPRQPSRPREGAGAGGVCVCVCGGGVRNADKAVPYIRVEHQVAPEDKHQPDCRLLAKIP